MIQVKPLTPIINWGDPLSNGLVIDIPLFEGAGTMARELVKGSKETFTGTPTWTTGNFGYGVVCNGTTDGIISTIDPNITAKKDNWTTECWFKVGSTAGEQVIMNLTRVNDNGLNSIEIESGKIKFLLNGVARVDTGVTPVVGQTYQVVLRRSAGTTVAFVNGVITSGSTVSNPDAQTVNNVNLGLARLNGSTLFRFFNGTVYLGRHWERPLSNMEIARLYFNPWAFYFKKYIYQDFSAGTPPSTSIKDLIGMGMIPFAR